MQLPRGGYHRTVPKEPLAQGIFSSQTQAGGLVPTVATQVQECGNVSRSMGDRAARREEGR